MSGTIGALIDRIRILEGELAAELAARRVDLAYRLENRRIVFEQDVLRRHREMKTRLRDMLLGARPLILLTAPFIYGVIVPIALLDLAVAVYQAVCFPIYGIAKVKRRDYIVFDRHRLAYLNAIEKMNCAYCSYANGLFAYVSEVASRTEQYWCPIKHAQRLAATHARYSRFADFGDAEGYQRQSEPLRRELHES